MRISVQWRLKDGRMMTVGRAEVVEQAAPGVWTVRVGKRRLASIDRITPGAGHLIIWSGPQAYCGPCVVESPQEVWA